MENKQEDPRITAAKEAAARRDGEDMIARRGSGALEYALHLADTGATAATVGVVGTTAVHYTNKMLNRPAKEPKAQVEVTKGYRPKES